MGGIKATKAILDDLAFDFGHRDPFGIALAAGLILCPVAAANDVELAERMLRYPAAPTYAHLDAVGAIAVRVIANDAEEILAPEVARELWEEFSGRPATNCRRVGHRR